MKPDDRAADGEPAPIRNRTDAGGPWSAAGALLALGLIGLMLVQSCMPSASSVNSSAAPKTTPPATR